MAQKMPRTQNVHQVIANPRVFSEKSGCLATLHHGEPIEMVTLRHEKFQPCVSQCMKCKQYHFLFGIFIARELQNRTFKGSKILFENNRI